MLTSLLKKNYQTTMILFKTFFCKIKEIEFFHQYYVKTGRICIRLNSNDYF